MHHCPISTEVLPERQRRDALGQFLTPRAVADFMASRFRVEFDVVDLIDAGSGEGALTAAFVRSLCSRSHKPRHIKVTAYELDPVVIPSLRSVLRQCERQCEQADVHFSSKVVNEDFIATATEALRGGLFAPIFPQFNAAIVNPPYKKIRSDSATREHLRLAGIETSNLYTAFIALICRLLVGGGELVSITPRSFCNGPYFRTFRSEFLQVMSLKQLHVFESRSAAFRGDDVLQENIIVHAIKGRSKPKQVIISTSSGQPGGLVKERFASYDEVVVPGDSERFIHLPTDENSHQIRAPLAQLKHSLKDVDLSVSTGRVVDFRATAYLRQHASNDTAPLIYPCHFNSGFVEWPNQKARKPNAIEINGKTKELLVSSGIYVLVKRFSSKEERRRIVACIYDPERIPAPWVGFENHLNYFHIEGSGMSMPLARGLAAFLNSTIIDKYFRQFSGHTQVNATDLRKLPYPSKRELENLGNKLDDMSCSQETLDQIIGKEVL